MKSDTPRTDAVLDKGKLEPITSRAYSLADHSRALERELAEARAICHHVAGLPVGTALPALALDSIINECRRLDAAPGGEERRRLDERLKGRKKPTTPCVESEFMPYADAAPGGEGSDD